VRRKGHNVKREFTIPITFVIVDDIREIGLGGLRQEWIAAKDPETGREYQLDAGTGLGSPLLESTVKDGTRRIYARANISDVATLLWKECDRELDRKESTKEEVT
jgi:hypothetical protein